MLKLHVQSDGPSNSWEPIDGIMARTALILIIGTVPILVPVFMQKVSFMGAQLIN